MVKARCQLKRQASANSVEVRIHVPDDADTPVFKTSSGYGSYHPESACLVWTIGYMPAGKEFTLRARMGLPSVREAEREKRLKPVEVRFEAPYYTVSGIQVRYLKVVEKSGYPSFPWVRYMTENGGSGLVVLMCGRVFVSSC